MQWLHCPTQTVQALGCEQITGRVRIFVQACLIPQPGVTSLGYRTVSSAASIRLSWNFASQCYNHQGVESAGIQEKQRPTNPDKLNSPFLTKCYKKRKYIKLAKQSCLRMNCFYFSCSSGWLQTVQAMMTVGFWCYCSHFRARSPSGATKICFLW